LEIAARDFAVAAHEERDQRYGSEPYVVHLLAVRQVLRDFGIEGPVAVGAWVHDVEEDTSRSREQVRQAVGEYVETLVWAVSGEGRNRKERMASIYRKIDSLPPAVADDATSLKLSDRVANKEASAFGPTADASKLAMYVREMAAFEEHLRGRGDPRLWKRLLQPSGAT
jgi:(p)ppGpp synthase/HD superfamily hydrolase